MDIQIQGLTHFAGANAAQAPVGKKPMIIQQASLPMSDIFNKSLQQGRAIANVRFGAIEIKDGPMAELQQRGVLVAGANGTMGNDILQNARQSKFNIVAMDQNRKLAGAAVQKIDNGLFQAKGKGILKDNQYWDIVKNTTATAIDGKKVSQSPEEGGYKPGDLPPVGIAIEAIFENLPAKQALFRNFERLLPEDTILATNTSSLSVDDRFTLLPARNG
jgi:hypothetical protein